MALQISYNIPISSIIIDIILMRPVLFIHYHWHYIILIVYHWHTPFFSVNPPSMPPKDQRYSMLLDTWDTTWDHGTPQCRNSWLMKYQQPRKTNATLKKISGSWLNHVEFSWIFMILVMTFWWNMWLSPFFFGQDVLQVGHNCSSLTAGFLVS